MNKKNIIAIVLFIFLILSAIFYTVYTVVGKELGDYKNGTVSIDSGILENISNKNTVNNTTDDEKDNKTNNNTSNKVTNNKTTNTTKKPNTTNTTKPNSNSSNTTTNNNTTNNTTPGNTTANNTTPGNTTTPSGNTTTPVKPDTPSTPTEPEVEPPKPIYSRFEIATVSSYYDYLAVSTIKLNKVSATEYVIQGEYDLNGLKGDKKTVPIIMFKITAPDSRFTEDIYANALISLDNEGLEYPFFYVSDSINKDTNKVPYVLIPVIAYPGYVNEFIIDWGDGVEISYIVRNSHTVKEIEVVVPEQPETPPENEGPTE